MINRLRTLRQALDYFFQAPAHKDIADRKLSEVDWQIIEDLEVVLKVPHTFQQSVSSEALPTLTHIIPVFKMFIIQWEHLSAQAPQCALFIEVGLHYAKEYYSHMGKTDVYAIAMFVDPTICFTWINAHWEDTDIAKAREAILKKMESYRHDPCVAPSNTMQNTVATGPPRPTSTKLGSHYGLPTLHPRQPMGGNGVQTIQQEFMSYITANCSPEATDALSFWVTTVAIVHDISHNLSNNYGLSSYPSIVSALRIPILMEALQMMKFFLKKECLNFMNGWATVQKEMLTEVADDDLLGMIVGAHVNRESLSHAIDNIISAIVDDEGDEFDDSPELFHT
ncbi:hypothetical protein SCLCIDRAFT_28178 [Scleroderma citrinum Foug A]|uniref:hAT-like transposase RNase-H fold domain-containing protein n=1 Tax=Scleroderma citrinum Foug A TaxID=1036808 RepID=A0A0C3A0S2_9AGAM|nr:hypothetical protein SCLCIDRAFT_28178 [Scleroderma citrinum Foug A]